MLQDDAVPERPVPVAVMPNGEITLFFPNVSLKMKFS
jgi:hypothetical protein